MGVALAYKLKRNDTFKSGLLKHDQLPAVLKDKDIKLDVGNKQLVVLRSCLQANPRGEFEIQEFLELACGADEGLNLYNTDLAVLEKGGEAAREQIERERTKRAGQFTVLRETTGARDPYLDSIGRKLIQTRHNYEEVFLAAIGPLADTAHPAIHESHFIKGLAHEKLRVTLTMEE